jgi:hypothetical protein
MPPRSAGTPINEVGMMTSPETPSPLVVIERADAFTGPGWMNARQAAYYTSSHVSTIRRICRHGGLRHIRIGHRNGPIRTRAEWVDAWMMRGAQGPVVH